MVHGLGQAINHSSIYASIIDILICPSLQKVESIKNHEILGWSL